MIRGDGSGVTRSLFQKTGLDLSRKSISNGIDHSSALFSLSHLETLNLAYNSLNSTPIPSSIGNLTNLRYLNSSNSGFSGQIPTGLSLLTGLVILDLASQNYLEKSSLKIENPNLSTLFGNHDGVKELYLDGVNISANGYEWGQAISSSMPNLRVLSLSNCYLSGPIDSSLRKLKNLYKVNLGNNNLASPIPDFFANFLNLTVLILSSSNLNGAFPGNILGKVQTLETLNLASNELLSGSLPYFPKNGSLRNLVLSFTSFSGNLPESIGSLTELRRIEIPGCNFSGPIPNSLAKLSQLVYLDFSSNNFSGPIPSFQGSKNLTYIDLSHNALKVGLQSEFIMPRLGVLDLHSNQLGGEIPLPPETAIYVDYSRNSFTTSIPGEIGNVKFFTNFFSLANNALTGPIPPSICNGSYLQVLDLSNNMLGGTIPQCLIENSTETLGVLNLGNNNLSGNIFGTFPQTCVLRTLDLNGNRLEGNVPESLSNCTMLEVLNLGRNSMTGMLKMVVCGYSLRNAKKLFAFTKPEEDLSPALGDESNCLLVVFSGHLPPKCFLHWNGMMIYRSYCLLRYEFLKANNLYYQDKVTVTVKGREMKLVKILTLFTAVDFSNNRFEGEIPDTIGALSSLHVLNLSRNALSGQIPSRLVNLTQLESLDLSRNNLNGSIPPTLARLTFLAVLDLSYNQLVGSIPRGNQFNTFSNTSFEVNKGLCGPPLIASCAETEPTRPTLDGRQSYTNEDKINWVYVTATLGYTVGFGVIVGPLLYSKRWRQWYYKAIDRVIVRIHYHREQRARHQRRRDNRNQLQRRQHH
ncbi:hypothetical protein RHMOL_Rhmol05G0307000 [Rhododendron molle]|uniref:Uncharacterized protein n=1 Tax=Rhododendron molle TaxID=49168 RepID=A0ACC0NWW8_RHOML|nr:hypothetical protein RHMOL_Rhmol05G0307000 [Rhododendron molle]